MQNSFKGLVVSHAKYTSLKATLTQQKIRILKTLREN